LTEFSGADFVEDVDGRKSTTGVIFFMANNQSLGSLQSKGW
jgi:hypothetical protein